MGQWRQRCLDDLATAAGSIDTLIGALRGIVQGLGFEHGSFVLRRPLPIAHPAVALGSTYPDAWLERYVSNHYLDRDPLVHRALRSPGPVVWSDASNDDLPWFWEEARAFDINHGWAVCIRGRGHSEGLLTVARRSGAVDAAELERSEARLLWLARTLHGLAASLPEMAPPASAALSAREREVLRWSAAGKTADEIGLILAISARTVNFHITRCIAKLDAANKTEAVAKALVLGLL